MITSLGHPAFAARDIEETLGFCRRWAQKRPSASTTTTAR